ncbi:hypothetical protein B0H34DRAFT_472192 [Crassisporium funariophilum]|nr:hypothetical protein B0H34DRAFT_472192 [Crassisporium funariophilum]
MALHLVRITEGAAGTFSANQPTLSALLAFDFGSFMGALGDPPTYWVLRQTSRLHHGEHRHLLDSGMAGQGSIARQEDDAAWTVCPQIQCDGQENRHTASMVAFAALKIRINSIHLVLSMPRAKFKAHQTHPHPLKQRPTKLAKCTEQHAIASHNSGKTEASYDASANTEGG